MTPPLDDSLDALRPDDLVSSRRFGSVIFATVETPNLSLVETPAVGTAIRAALDAATGSLSHLVIDLGKVSFMNSMALGMLVSVYTSALNRGAVTVLASVGEDLDPIIRATKLDRLFVLCATPEDLERVLS